METTTLLTVEEASQQLRVSPDTIRRYLRDQKMRGVRVGGQWRIPAGALHQMQSPPMGEVLEEQIITITDHEENGVTIPAGTVGYVIAHTRNTGGLYGESVVVHETPARLMRVGAPQQFPDFTLSLFEQNQTWRFLPNDGTSRLVQVPRAVLQELRTLLNDAHIASTETERWTALKTAYMAVRGTLGTNDRTDDDAILKAIEEEARALWNGVPPQPSKSGPSKSVR